MNQIKRSYSESDTIFKNNIYLNRFALLSKDFKDIKDWKLKISNASDLETPYIKLEKYDKISWK